MNNDQRAAIPLDMAGEIVTGLVAKNVERVLGTRTLGKQRQQDSRNILNETMFSRFEVVSMLAVALDRLAVYQALTPTLSVDRGVFAANAELRRQGIDPQMILNVKKLVEAVLAR